MNKKLLVFVLVVLFAVATASSALYCQSLPKVSMTFEDNMDADTPEGKVSPTVKEKPALVPGRNGMALKSGPGYGYLEFPSSLLNASAGTVEMWVCPLDWTEKDEEFHVFFDVQSEKGTLFLYKYHQANAILMLSSAQPEGPLFSSSKAITWKPGEWHHIAGTWSDAGVMAYVDGEPAGMLPVQAQLPTGFGEFFTIGDIPWHIERKTSSLIDDVRIYDRALSPAHIAAHFKGDYNFTAPLTKESLVLHANIDPQKKQVVAKLNTGGADVEDSDITAQVALLPKMADFPINTEEQSFRHGMLQVELPIDISKPASYVLMVRVQPKGADSIVLQREIIVPDLATWKGRKLGKEDVALAPWTPVKQLAAGILGVWDRKYDLNSAGLVNQMYSGGKKLLSRPIEIVQHIDGVKNTLKAGRVSVVSSKPTKVALKKVLTSGKSSVTLDTYTEYDGLMWLTLTGKIDPDTESLTIEIPLRPEIALYRHRFHNQWDSTPVTGNLPKRSGVVDNDHFVPYYWFGNNDRGLIWCCESDEFWPNSEDSQAIQVVREDSEVILRLNIIDKGQKLADNWRFEFGLQATPVKPLPENWRRWRLDPMIKHNVNIMWPGPGEDSIKYFGYPEATNPKLMTERVNDLHRQKIAAVPYLCLTYLSEACPEWPFYKKLWAMGPVDSLSSDVMSYGVGFAMVSPLGKDYSDFIVWKTAEFMKQYGVDGLYHDCTNPLGTTALDAGVGYMRDGKLRPTHPLLGYRDLYRRMYAVAKKLKPNGFTMAHISANMLPPVLGYEDSTLDGEHFRGKVKDSYMDLMGMDTFRAQFMGRQFGVIPFFLPEFDEENMVKTEPTRGMMAMLMLHDVLPWPIWCNVAEVNRAINMLDLFGYVDSEFIGYFESQPPAYTDAKDVYVSAYKRPGKTLLVVGNVGRESQKAEIRLNSKALGAIKSISTWPDVKSLSVKNGQVEIDVQGLGYTMLLVK